MKQDKKLLRNIILAIVIALVGYVFLVNSSRPAMVDMIMETLLFIWAGLVGLFGYKQLSKNRDRNIKRFALNYGLTYLIVAVASLIAVYYLVQHPSLPEIGVETIMESNLLIFMGGLRSVSFIPLLIGWFSFYKYLGVKASKSKQIGVFLLGFLIYFGCSLIIMNLTGDSTVLGLGIMLGFAIGLFAMIAQHPATKYLTVIFILFSSVHLWDFYIMGLGHELSSGINNPVYWGIWVLYILEVRHWIQNEVNRINYSR